MMREARKGKKKEIKIEEKITKKRKIKRAKIQTEKMTEKGKMKKKKSQESKRK